MLSFPLMLPPSHGTPIPMLAGGLPNPPPFAGSTSVARFGFGEFSRTIDKSEPPATGGGFVNPPRALFLSD
ncbi:hypothetical protein QUF80_19645 [Desulfococcaceae bacterium HSG8]|nr:hypothetical protein [Desulfococcaceae bacterium HSG8]